MTTFDFNDVSCAICGHTQTVWDLMSTNQFGPSDLDTRPPEMARSTMAMWLSQCDGCGYVADNLGHANDAVVAVVRSEAYAAEHENQRRPALANRFVCRALLDEATGAVGAAAWHRLHAAWACDDAGAESDAVEQRLAALDRFERARADGKPATEDQLTFHAVVVDLARRTRQFAKALAYCEKGHALELESDGEEAVPFHQQLFAFQRRLCEAEDCRCHDVGEIDV